MAGKRPRPFHSELEPLQPSEGQAAQGDDDEGVAAKAAKLDGSALESSCSESSSSSSSDDDDGSGSSSSGSSSGSSSDEAPSSPRPVASLPGVTSDSARSTPTRLTRRLTGGEPASQSGPESAAYARQVNNLGLNLSDTESQFNLDPFLNQGQGPMDPCCVAEEGEESSPHHGAADVCIEGDHDNDLSSLVSENLSSQLSSRVASPNTRAQSLEDLEEPPVQPAAQTLPSPPPLPQDPVQPVGIPPPPGPVKEEPSEAAQPPRPTGNAAPSDLSDSEERRSPFEDEEEGMEQDEHDEEEDDDDEDDDDDEMDDEVLHKLLDETANLAHQKEHEEEEIVPKEERRRSILIEKGLKNNFDVLPSGWIKVCHSSGFPVYLHRESRVVTLSRPYHIGAGSARKHFIPVDSIPCLNYKRGLEEEDKFKEKARLAAEQGQVSCPNLPQAKIETQKEAAQTNSVSPDEFKQYCSNLFQFKEISIKRFKSWTERRRYMKQTSRKQLQKAIDATKEAEAEAEAEKLSEPNVASNSKGPKKKAQLRPTLPSGTAIISIPVVELEKVENQSEDTALNHRVVKKTKKDWLLNPQGKSYVCILHEYIQQSLRTQPHYSYCEAQSSTTPYQCTVNINGIEYGTGVGASKKTAKGEAAKKTLEILIPDIIHKIEKTKTTPKDHSDLEFFDDIRVDDPRVSDLCNKASEPSPYGILTTCLQRNYALGDTNIHMELKPMRFQKNEFIMRVNNREVSVVCRTKKDGKQLAAQKLLQLLHPNVTSWGALLRLYGSRSAAYLKAKRERETEITGLQSRNSSRPMPSLAILEKLKEEMRSIAQRKKEMPDSENNVGKFLPPIGSLDVPIALPNSELSRIAL